MLTGRQLTATHWSGGCSRRGPDGRGAACGCTLRARPESVGQAGRERKGLCDRDCKRDCDGVSDCVAWCVTMTMCDCVCNCDCDRNRGWTVAVTVTATWQ
eukprot:162262-Chlamydomonas_euryale.AAC.1